MAPDPMVVANDTGRIEVRTVAQGMGISHHDDIVMVGDRRSDSRINAQVGRPPGNEHPIRRDPVEACLQVRANGSFKFF